MFSPLVQIKFIVIYFAFCNICDMKASRWCSLAYCLVVVMVRTVSNALQVLIVFDVGFGGN